MLLIIFFYVTNNFQQNKFSFFYKDFSKSYCLFFSESLAYNFVRFNYMLYLCKQVYAHHTF